MAFFGLGATDKVKAKRLKEEGCLVVLSIEVPHEKTVGPLEKAFKAIREKAAVPGFRQGKAPLEIVKKHFAGYALERMVDEVVREVLPGILEEQKLHPVAPPMVHDLERTEGKPLKFQVSLECSPRFEARDYRKIAVTRKKRAITDKTVEENLQKIAERSARLDPVLTETVEKTHHVLIDYEGFLAGSPIEGGKGRDEWVDMAAPQTVAGLTEGILGARRGETREVPVTLQGAEKAMFRVNVKEIKKKVAPPLDDELAKDQGLGSLGDLKAKMREILEKSAAAQADKDLESQIAESLQKANPIPVPASIVEAELKRMIDRFLASIGIKELGAQETENLKARLKPAAESEVRMAYLLRAIGEKEKIAVTEAEVAAERERALAGSPDEAQKKQTTEFFDRHGDAVREHLWEGKVWKLLKDNAKVKEVEALDPS